MLLNVGDVVSAVDGLPAARLTLFGGHAHYILSAAM